MTEDNELVYGGDYNPDQWPRETWDEDIRLMRQAHVNRVTLGVFSWSSLEPREGEYEVEWLDTIMDKLADAGIGVVLATPTASPPPWFSLAHPEALPVRPDGVRLVHGSRDTYNPAAPAYREAAVRITRMLAERYGQHPALRMWHLHNEYGTVSHGPVSDEAFRVWLRARYGTLEALNAAWWTAFWSQGYGAWEEILTPRATQYLPNPAHVLDFKRFSADLLRDCLRDQVEVVRAVTPDVPVTTNFMLPSWHHYDEWDLAAEIDTVSIDHYPAARDVEGEVHAAFGADLARSFNGGRPWTLMEQATSTVYDYAAGRIFAKEPGRLERNTMQYLARGATGSLFFQWRNGRGGAEMFHSPMVPHTGPDSRVFREICDLGATLGRLGELAAPPADGGPVNRNRVAFVWDSTAWWSSETRAMPTDDLSFLDAVRAAHRALWWEGIGCDAVRLGDDLSAYDVVLVPSKLAVSDDEAQALHRFVEQGGTAVVWYFAGSTDELLRVRQGSFSGAFADLLGIRVEELHPLAPGETVTLDDGTTGDCWSQLVQLRGAEALAHVTGGVLDGVPAITRHDVGAGAAYHVGTRLEPGALRRLLADVVARAGVTRDHPAAGDGLEVVRRHAGPGTYLLAVNHDEVPRALTVDGHDLLADRPVAGEVVLAPGAHLVLRETARTPLPARPVDPVQPTP